jgi:hypothetical protein
VIKVPSVEPTIQDAVDVASEGDTILVAAGIYDDYQTRTVERPTTSVELTANVFLEKALVLTSESGAEATVIESPGLGPVIVCNMVQGCVLEGFTIRGGCVDETLLDGGGGLYCEWSHLDIRDNIIEDNCGPFGGGIGLFTGSTAEIHGNIIRDNRGDAFGGAVAVFEAGGSTTIEGNVIANNSAAVNGGGLFLTSQASALVQNNTIVGNSAVGGSAVFCRNGTEVTFVRNIVAFGSGNCAVFCDTLGTSTPCTITSSCNDFWGGEGDNFAGCEAGPGDITANPFFCSYENGDYTLCVFSPSLGVGDSCGLRGALPSGCWECAVEERRLTWGLLKTRYR